MTTGKGYLTFANGIDLDLDDRAIRAARTAGLMTRADADKALLRNAEARVATLKGPVLDVLDGPAERPLVFAYKNWEGEWATRRVIPKSVRFGVSEWHREPQWLMLAVDIDKGALREFAMKDMSEIRTGR